MVFKALSSLGGFDIAKYIAMALLVVGVAGVFLYQEHKIESKNKLILEYESELSAAGAEINKNILINEHNEKEFQRYKINQEKTITSLMDQHQKELKNAISFQKIKGEITHAKKTDDALAAPVLVNTFLRMQQHQTNSSQNSDKAQNSKTKDTR